MSYTVANPQPAGLPAGVTGVVLDTGERIAVSAHIETAPGNVLSIKAHATQIEQTTAVPVLDGNGRPVSTNSNHVFQAQAVAAYTVPALIREMIGLALGEPATIFGATPAAGAPILPPIDHGVLAAWSIRNAIAASVHAGPVTNLGSLL